MVKKSPSSRLKTNAFSLIEVIFAIIIMGMTMVTLPVMMSSNEKGIDTSLIQEAIFGASAELNQALSFRWDENSIDESVDPDALGLASVIKTSFDDCENNASKPNYRLRPGHIVQTLHRKCLLSNTTTPTASASLGSEAGDLDDVDDISTTSKSLFVGYSANADGYKQDFQSSVNISYNTMDGRVGANDAKLIIVTVTDADGNTVTSLRSYTLNIGEVDMYHRPY